MKQAVEQIKEREMYVSVYSALLDFSKDENVAVSVFSS